MAKKKKRKPPAKAPVIRHRLPSEEIDDEEEEEDLSRPDPDQPPLEGATGRPSIYSEWLNAPAARPSVFSQWLNLPETAPPTLPPPEPPAPPKGPRPTARIPIADLDAGGAPAVSPDQPRRRRTTAARRLSPAERLEVDTDRLNAPTARGRPPAPGGFGPGQRDQSTRVLPALPEDAPRRATAARLPATFGETTTRIPTPRQGTAGRLPTPRQDADRRAPPLDRRATAAPFPATRRATAASPPAPRRTARPPATGYASPDSGLLIRGPRHPRPSLQIVPRRLRPPSLVMHLTVALAMICVLLGTLAVVSPLGYGAAISGTFQAYANSLVWVPTPTATPRPPSSTLPPSPGQQVVTDTITSVFGQYAAGALNVARCESGYNPLARNPYPVGNSHAEGVFQILYPSTWNTTSYATQNPYDYNANIHAAWQIFSRDGYSWREWACQP
jgi:hypothetical protein